MTSSTRSGRSRHAGHLGAVLLSSDAVQARVRDEFQGVEAELISTNLSTEQEDKLREAFATED